MKSLRKLISVLLIYALPVFPWGKVGHETIAYIAYQNLTESTKTKIKPYLEGKSIEEIYFWASVSVFA